MKIFESNSPADTVNIGMQLAENLSGGDVVAFFGDLGAGKTCLTGGIAKGLGYNGIVTSPTFALINEYAGGRLPLYHFDMYRILSWDDLYSSGYFDYLEAGGVIAAEWSENIENALPTGAIRVTVEKIGESSRKITVSGKDF